jgi:hypothetical protein
MTSAIHPWFGVVDPVRATWLQTYGIRLGIILGLAVAVSVVGKLWIRRFRRRLEGTPDLTQALDLKRTTTIVTR